MSRGGGYQSLVQLKRRVPDIETYGQHTAGEVYDMEPTHETFWRVAQQIVSIAEGEFSWLYRDISGHPTTGVGYLVCHSLPNGSIAAAQRAFAQRTLGQFEWHMGGIHGRVASPAEVMAEFDHFVSATQSLVSNGHVHKNAAGQEHYSTMRMVDTPDLFRRKVMGQIGDQNYWAGVTARIPDWRNKPYTSVVAMLSSVWNTGPAHTGKHAARAHLLSEDLVQNHFRDHEEALARYHTRASTGGNPNAAMIWNFRDLEQCAAKYFCVERCNGACTNKERCNFKDTSRRGPQTGSRTPQPLAVVQPRMEPRASNSKYDEWKIELRVWDPANVSGCYEINGETGGAEDGTLHSMRGDGHADFGNMSEASSDPKHRVLLTAKFRYHYLEQGGRKVGQFISAEGLDPAPAGAMRTASVQTLGIFGRKVRYRSEDQGQTWTADTNATFPASDATGTRVLWAPRAQNFESFTLQVTAENPTAPRTAPGLSATLRGRFDGDKLKLTLECAKYPSVGVRARRTRDGSEAEMLPGYQTPLVDAKKQYEDWVKARGHEVPPPGPAWNTPAGAPEDSLQFQTTFANQRFTWNHDIDWVNGPEAAQTAQQPTPQPQAPAVRTGSRNLKELYDRQDRSELYDVLANVWHDGQTEFGRNNPTHRNGFDLARGQGEINLLGVRSCPLGTLRPHNVSFAPDQRSQYDDTMFVLWIDLEGRKHVEGFVYGSEPTCTAAGNRGGISWIATGQHQYAIGVHHKDRPYRPLSQVATQGFSHVGYRALNPVGIGALCWMSSGTPLRPAMGRTHNDGTVNIHWGGENEQTSLVPYSASPWSKGCQVIAHRSRYIALWRLIEADTSIEFAPYAVSTRRNHLELVSATGGAHNRKLTYTLVNGDVLLRLGYS